jgi:hypothetical protein
MFQNAWHNFDWRIAVTLFLAYAFVDAIFVLYTLAVTRHQALKAANFSFIYYFVIAVGVFEYVHNFLYIVTIACGSWLGTFMIVQRERRQTE